MVGGDHSVPFGALEAVAAKHACFGVLHFDAHSDTRHAYEGFEHSHASIMHNVLEHILHATKLVQVGIRERSGRMPPQEFFTRTNWIFMPSARAFRHLLGRRGSRGLPRSWPSTA